MSARAGQASPGRFDAVVVGAGVVGLAAARRLASAGARVALLDADPRGGGGTRAAAGVAVPSLRLASDPPLRELARLGLARLHADVDHLASRAADLRRYHGILRPVAGHGERAALEASCADDTAALGAWIGPEELAEREPGLRAGAFTGAYEAGEAAMVDADAYVDALMDEAAEAGVALRLGEAVQEVADAPGAATVRTTAGRLRAGAVLVAAGAWSGVLGGLPQLAVRPQRGQLLLVRRPGTTLRHIVSGRLYAAPWHGGAICVGATEEDAGFAAHCTPAGLALLSTFAIKLLPALAEARVRRTWAGLRSVTPSGRPLIGRYPGTRHVLVATGLGGQGVLTGALVGEAAAELADTGDSDIARPFAPERARA